MNIILYHKTNLFLVIIIIFFINCNSIENKSHEVTGKDSMTIHKQSEFICLDSNMTNLNDSCKTANKISKAIIYYSKLPLKLKDSCIVANNIRTVILDFIKKKNTNIYLPTFVNLLKENSSQNKCYFPRNNEELHMYYFLIDSILCNESQKDNRAIKLCFDLYLNNRYNAEFAESFFYTIPCIAVNNINGFIETISMYEDDEIESIIEYLGELDENQITKIKQTMTIKSKNKVVILVNEKLNMLQLGENKTK